MLDLILKFGPWALAVAVATAVLYRFLQRSDAPGPLAARWIASALIIAGMFWWAERCIGRDSGGYAVDFVTATMAVAGVTIGAILLAIIWGRQLGELVVRPLTSLFDDGGTELRPSPLYAIAEARRKQGRPHDAIREIQNQLERFPGDLQGSLLLARTHAEDLHDLPTAQALLEEWLDSHPSDSGHHKIIRLQLAHWQLDLAHDLDAARRTLHQIILDFPNSEAALLAEQRLAHMEHHASQPRAAIALPTHPTHPDQIELPPSPEIVETAKLVDQLQQHPHDLAARERLAILYAWHHRQPELARTEIESLLALPQTTPRQATHWLNLLADLEIQVAQDLSRARSALQRIIDQQPKLAAADQARTRMHFLPRELTRHAHAPTVAPATWTPNGSA
jgi:tetratricopeptide (TPR) repeat protein